MQSIKPLFLVTAVLLLLADIGYSMTQTQLTFKEEVELLEKNFTPIVLKQGMRRVSVVPELQGRVMTSSARGDNVRGFGWINYEYLSKPHTDNNGEIGGADRLWLGPQAGPYSLFYEYGKEQIEIEVPDAISLTPFDLIGQSATHVAFRKQLEVTNHQGFKFQFLVDRTIKLFSSSEIEAQLQLSIPSHVDYIGFGSETSITNTGRQSWVKESGLISMWSMGAFYPSLSTTAVVPMKQGLERATPYFNETRSSHTRIKGSTLFYYADAQYMNKIGIPPENTLPILGSYDASRQLMTLVTFHVAKDPNASYVNSVFYEQADPYAGEIINIYNDGPRPNVKPFGKFYELESSSVALELAPHEAKNHFHRTYHFQGDKKALSKIAKQLLGVDIYTIETAFAN